MSDSISMRYTDGGYMSSSITSSDLSTYSNYCVTTDVFFNHNATNVGKVYDWYGGDVLEVDPSKVDLTKTTLGLFVNKNGQVGIGRKISNFHGSINGISFECDSVYTPATNNGKIRVISFNVSRSYYYAVIWEEQEITKEFWNFSNCTIDTSKPYEPNENNISGTVTVTSVTFSSLGAHLNYQRDLTGVSEIHDAYVDVYGLEEYYTTPNTSIILVSSPENGFASPSTITIDIGSWDNHLYRIDDTGHRYSNRFGEEIDRANILKAFKVTEVFSNEYKTLEIDKYTQLPPTATMVVNQVIGQLASNLTISVSVDGTKLTKKLPSLSVTDVRRTDTFTYGDVFTSAVNDLSKLEFVYEDSSTMTLDKKASNLNVLIRSSSIPDGSIIDTSYGHFSLERINFYINSNAYFDVATDIQPNYEMVTDIEILFLESNWHWGDLMSVNGFVKLETNDGFFMDVLDFPKIPESWYESSFPFNRILNEDTSTYETNAEITFNINGNYITTHADVRLFFADAIALKNIRTPLTQYISDGEELLIDNDYKIVYWNEDHYEDRDITDVTISHNPINYTERSVNMVTFTGTYEGRTLSNSFNITTIPVELVGARCTTQYITAYDSGATVFQTSNLSFEKVYNSGLTQSIPTSSVTFFRDSECKIAIFNGNKITNSYSDKIYFKVSGMADFVGEIKIDFVHDTLMSVELLGSSFILGNRPNKDFLTLKATFKSGSVNNNYKDYNFTDNSFVISSSPLTITADGKTFTITPSYDKPRIDGAKLKLNGAKTSFQNRTPIDFKMVQMEIEYRDAEYKNIISFGNGLSCAVASSSYEFDGTTPFNVDMNGSTNKEVVVDFNAYDELADDTFTISTTLSIYEISNISGIQVVSAKTEYGINEYFLNENDETTVRVYYEDEDNKTTNQLIKLNSGFPYLNTTIVKGTKLTKEGTYTITITSAMNSGISASYTIYVAPSISYDDGEETVYLVAVKNSSDSIYYLYEETPSNPVTYVANGRRYLKSDKLYSPVGYVKNVGNFNKNGVVVLYNDYIAPNDSESNMEVKFPCYVSGYADQINKCTFGVLFGNNNAKNRLFVSGNPDMPNYDWHTGETFSSGDLTYFSDLSYCAYGQTSNAVVGYDIVSDGKLAVFKSKSAIEPTIYYRTSSYVQAIDPSGNALTGIDGNSLYQEEYPLTTGNIGFGAISHESITNFNGDTIFLSSGKELDGLDVVGEIGNSQRHANTRSAFIDPKIKDKDLSNSIVWTDNTTLYLAFDDELYQCDYRSQAENSTQYEWWRSDIRGIKSMCLINDVIYFGNRDGELCLLEGNDYYDNEKIFVSYGGGYLASVDPSDNGVMPNTMYVNSSYISDLVGRKGCKVRLYKDTALTKVPFAQVCTIGNIEGLYDLYITENALGDTILKVDCNGDFKRVKYIEKLVKEGVEYFLNPYDNEVSGEISAGNCDFDDLDQPYELKWEFEGFGLYKRNANGKLTRVDVSMLYRAGLCTKLNGVYPISEIKEITLGSTPVCVFNILDEDGEPYDLVNHGNTSLDSVFPFELIIPKPVEAYYITSPFVMGNLSYSKTIWSWTITDDTDIKHSLRLGTIYSFDKMREVGNYLEQNSWLKKAETPLKYTFVKPMKCPFVCFFVKNNEGENSVLSTIQIQYTLSSNAYSKF